MAAKVEKICYYVEAWRQKDDVLVKTCWLDKSKALRQFIRFEKQNFNIIHLNKTCFEEERFGE